MSEPGAPPPPERNPYAVPPGPASPPGPAVPPGPAQPPPYWQAPPYGQSPSGPAQRPPYSQAPPYGQQPPPYGRQPWPAQPPPRTPGTNGFAIAALVCGILPLIPVAIVFGIIALGQTAGRRKEGRWLAVTGMAAAGVWTVALVLGGVPTQFLRPDPDPVPLSVLQDGECIDGLSGLDRGRVPSPIDLPEVPCDGPHEGEVYGTFELDDGPYPGEAAVTAETGQRCRDLLRATPPDTVSGATIGYIYLYPLEHWWPEHRTAVCVAYDPEDVQVPGLEPIPRA